MEIQKEVLEIIFPKGVFEWFDLKEGDLLDQGVARGVIGKSGNSYSYEEEKLGMGRENAKMYLRQNPKLYEKIRKVVWEMFRQEKEA